MPELVSVEKIDRNEWNPNVMGEKEYAALKQDMQLHGPEGVDPILVSPFACFFPGEQPNDRFVIVDGEHRWRIAKDLGWKEILCEVKPITEDDAKGICYRRNRERGNIDPFKEARLFQSEVLRKRSQKEIAEKYLVERSQIAHRLSLLKLDKEVVDAVTRVTGITPSHLEPIATLEPADQKELVKNLIADAKTGHVDPVREVTEHVSRIKEAREEERQLAEALKTAKFPKCPKCRQEPTSIHYNKLPWVRCDHYHEWNLETGKGLYEENRIQQDKLDGKPEVRLSSVLRSAHTVEELGDIFAERIKEIVPRMEKVNTIRISGILDNSAFRFELHNYGNSGNVSVSHGGNDNGFNVEKHEYRSGEKSAVHCGRPEDIEKVKAFIEAAFNGQLAIEPKKRKKKEASAQ